MNEPFRIHVFPDRPEFILIYAPPGSFQLPRLGSPFVQGEVKEACNLAGLEVRVSEAVPGRWTKAMLKAKSDARAERRQRQNLKVAVEATVLRGASSEDERERAELLLDKQRVDEDLARLKLELREAMNRVHTEGRYMPRREFQRKEARIEQLKLESQAIQVRLSELKAAEKARNIARDVDREGEQTRYIKTLRAVLRDFLDSDELQDVDEEVDLRLVGDSDE